MIRIENVEVTGFMDAIRGMRNPMNSWEKSDSGECDNYFTKEHNCGFCDDGCYKGYYIGKNDYDLMIRLARAGSEHAKYRRMIIVYADITAPLYWWKQFETYKIGTVSNSCSTMHKIHSKPFTRDDFSHEYLTYYANDDESCLDFGDLFERLLGGLNVARDLYIKTDDKKWWWQMIQLLPESYNQRRTVMLNYEVLANIYRQRKDHKLDEWREFCKFIETLPMKDTIVFSSANNDSESGENIEK